MEADRGAVLTLRAAAAGVVDFSEARVRDVRWWRRVNALVRAMAARDDLIAVRAAFDLQRSLVGNGGLTDKSFEASQKAAKALFGDILEALYPWTAGGQAGAAKIDDMVASYKKLVGDPDDPEFQKKLVHDLGVVEARDAAAATVGAEETEDARIDRLLRERDARYAAGRRG